MANVRVQYQILKVAPKIVDYCWIYKHVLMLLVPKVQVCGFSMILFALQFNTWLNFRRVFLFLWFLVEELTCLATWKDGNSRYLVGLVSHHHAVSNEERYRCFVYEKILSSGKFCRVDSSITGFFANIFRKLIR